MKGGNQLKTHIYIYIYYIFVLHWLCKGEVGKRSGKPFPHMRIEIQQQQQQQQQLRFMAFIPHIGGNMLYIGIGM